jgi:uncharacterized protein YbaP (TraB family)
MNWTRRSVLAAGAAATASPGFAAERDAYPLWVVSAGRSKVILFGDCGSPTDPWRSPRVEAAFDVSPTFWKETPDLGPADIDQFVAKGTDRNRPLSSWLTAAQRDRVESAGRGLGLSYDQIKFCQPWLAAASFSQASARQQKPSADPLTVLTAAAGRMGKTVRTEFRDAPSLIESFVATPPAAQVEYLMYTIDTVEASASDPQAWPRREAAWAAGDLRLETERVVGEMRDYPLAYEAETAARNRRWPARFRAMLDGGGTTFVLVGADHLVGPQSVLAHLEAAGLNARRL